jgi:hypothetical protein
MQFKFEYQDNSITFISNYTGTEKVYVNGEVVSTKSKSNSPKFKNVHDLFIGEDALQIKSEITGAFIPKLNVSLYDGNDLLESKTQIYNGALDINIVPKMSKDESYWVHEIEVSSASTIMMYGLYGGLMVFTVGDAFFDDNIISHIGLIISGISVVSAIASFVRTSYFDLVRRPE